MMNLFRTDEPVIALGFMSGTSLDGLDAALLETDGRSILDFGPKMSIPYDRKFRQALRSAVESAAVTNTPCASQALIDELTDLHVQLAKQMMDSCVTEGTKWSAIGIVGMHGHTVLHRPNLHLTQQIGNGTRLAKALSIPVIGNLRNRDVELGGEGAPLAPVYHAALYHDAEKPICVVNIGGISNLTWIGPGDGELVAFDTGPGNGLLDRWVELNTGEHFDQDGDYARQGGVVDSILERFLEDPFYSKPFPKSLDRSDLSIEPIRSLSLVDGAATLAAYTVESILAGIHLCPSPPRQVFVTGGGRHNKAMMELLRGAAPCDVAPVEDSGWDGDAVEAQAFAFLAVRAAKGMPITFSGTTGAPRPLTGGELFLP